MGTGKIVDFTKPVPPEERVAQDPPLQRLSSSDATPQGIEVRVHENVIVENDRVRSLIRRPGDPEIKLRDGDPKMDVTRIEDDD